jgi:hypothetical protein
MSSGGGDRFAVLPPATVLHPFGMVGEPPQTTSYSFIYYALKRVPETDLSISFQCGE